MLIDVPRFLQIAGWSARALALIVMTVPVATGTSVALATPAGVSCGIWGIVPAPRSSTATAYLNGIAGTSDRDIWAVGYHADQSGDNQKTLIRHWNGTTWSAVASPNAQHGGELSAVVALSPSNAWAV